MNKKISEPCQRLSYDRSDIERIFGFKSKKFTMVNYVFTACI